MNIISKIYTVKPLVQIFSKPGGNISRYIVIFHVSNTSHCFSRHCFSFPIFFCHLYGGCTIYSRHRNGKKGTFQIEYIDLIPKVRIFVLYFFYLTYWNWNIVASRIIDHYAHSNQNNTIRNFRSCRHILSSRIISFPFYLIFSFLMISKQICHLIQILENINEFPHKIYGFNNGYIKYIVPCLHIIEYVQNVERVILHTFWGRPSIFSVFSK